jgi:hypothetical protein
VKAFARLEALIERVVDSSLVGLTGARLEPVEIAKRLARAMENGRIIGVSGPIVPNGFVVRLSSADFAQYESVREALEKELQSYLASVARERHLNLLGAPVVRVEVEPSLRRHQFGVTARLEEPPPAATMAGHTERFAAVAPAVAATPAPKPQIQVTITASGRDGSAPIRVDRARFAIGRALDNQLVIEDSRVSRYHAAVLIVDTACSIRDLESTNGTWVNGIRIREKRLLDGDVVSLGGTELRIGIVGDMPRERQ